MYECYGGICQNFQILGVSINMPNLKEVRKNLNLLVLLFCIEDGF